MAKEELSPEEEKEKKKELAEEKKKRRAAKLKRKREAALKSQKEFNAPLTEDAVYLYSVKIFLGFAAVFIIGALIIITIVLDN